MHITLTHEFLGRIIAKTKLDRAQNCDEAYGVSIGATQAAQTTIRVSYNVAFNRFRYRKIHIYILYMCVCVSRQKGPALLLACKHKSSDDTSRAGRTVELHGSLHERLIRN